MTQDIIMYIDINLIIWTLTNGHMGNSRISIQIEQKDIEIRLQTHVKFVLGMLIS